MLSGLALVLVVEGGEFDTVVTGTRTPRGLEDAPIQTLVITRAELERSPTLFTDELVRSSPLVQTFRTSSSLTADPTSQGLSLRGIGPSGVSRATLLVDGIPINDGYGGWIFWRALPRLGVDHLELSPGAASAQYGSGALGGVVQLLSRPLLHDAVDADAEAGTQGLLHGAARVALVGEALAGAIELEGLRSQGFPVVAPASRGPIDASAPSADLTANGRLEARLKGQVRGLVSGGYFDETQSAGTPLSGAHVQLGHLELGLDWEALGHWQARLFGRLEHLAQTRTRVDAERTSETLTATQAIAIDDEGLLVGWSAPPLPGFGTHLVSAGVDARVVGAQGQRQEQGGLFLQDAWKLTSSLEAVGALRVDGWHQGSRGAGALSPKLAAHFCPRPGVHVRAATYRAFRAPTLNELYRPFQVGTILTAPNAALDAETLTGGELGVEVSTLGGFTARVTGFANTLDAPIVSVSLADGTRQRQNLGAARIIGLEASAEWRFAHDFLLSAGYSLIDARVVSSAQGLTGKQLPQDPAHRFTAALSYSNLRWVTVQVQVRVLSTSFEDDRNTLALPAFAVVDASVTRALGRGFELFAAAQNVLGTSYLVGRAGIDTVGPPFSVHAGLRFRSDAR